MLNTAPVMYTGMVCICADVAVYPMRLRIVGWQFAIEFAFSVTPMFIATLSITSVLEAGRLGEMTYAAQTFQSFRWCSTSFGVMGASFASWPLSSLTRASMSSFSSGVRNSQCSGNGTMSHQLAKATTIVMMPSMMKILYREPL